MRGASEKRLTNLATGGSLIALGCLPFAVARVGPFPPENSVAGLEGACLARAALDIPCPVCGGMRAFSLASGGDLRLLEYNFFWVLAAIFLILTGCLTASGLLSLRGFWSRTGSLPIVLLAGALIGGWAVALLNKSSILA